MRKKKYVEIIAFKEDMIALLHNEPGLIERSYTLTTSGGKNILWQVNLPKNEIIFTLSTEALQYIRVNNFIKVPEYKHFVLTEKGLKIIKEHILEEKL
jgi:hypothetical protein